MKEHRQDMLTAEKTFCSPTFSTPTGDCTQNTALCRESQTFPRWYG
jgi:hypothetical protein